MRYTQKAVLERLDYFNALTGRNFKADYHSGYGGWCMYEKNKLGGCCRSYFGFDYRKSTTEFMAYLNGLITAFNFLGEDISIVKEKLNNI